VKIVDVRLKGTVDNSYSVRVGESLANTAKRIIRHQPASGYFIITDSNVRSIYGAPFLRRMNSGATPSHLITVPAGERSKSRLMKNRIEDKIMGLGADRDSLIIALGGGMIGDLAGFVASTLHRGVSYVQIPTTLLSQVDSSVGGKVAVNHPMGKNLIGAFYQPKGVYIDPSTILTLKEADFTGGLSEVVKYGAILDPSLFALLQRKNKEIMRRKPALMTHIIARCCELKSRVVHRDEKESSYRRILNFGHTLGHAVESASGYRISHGQAVAIGMCLEARIAEALGILSSRALLRLIGLLWAFDLPTELPAYISPETIVGLSRRDKKFRKGAVRYTLIGQIGSGIIDVPLQEKEVLRIIRP
jgi:3-dehydroquinate synthase